MRARTHFRLPPVNRRVYRTSARRRRERRQMESRGTSPPVRPEECEQPPGRTVERHPGERPTAAEVARHVPHDEVSKSKLATQTRRHANSRNASAGAHLFGRRRRRAQRQERGVATVELRVDVLEPSDRGVPPAASRAASPRPPAAAPRPDQLASRCSAAPRAPPTGHAFLARVSHRPQSPKQDESARPSAGSAATTTVGNRSARPRSARAGSPAPLRRDVGVASTASHGGPSPAARRTAGPRSCVQRARLDSRLERCEMPPPAGVQVDRLHRRHARLSGP